MGSDEAACGHGLRQFRKFGNVDLAFGIGVRPVEGVDHHGEILFRRLAEHLYGIVETASGAFEGDPELDADGALREGALQLLLLPVGILRVQIGEKKELPRIPFCLLCGVAVGPAERGARGEGSRIGAPADEDVGNDQRVDAAPGRLTDHPGAPLRFG